MSAPASGPIWVTALVLGLMAAMIAAFVAPGSGEAEATNWLVVIGVFVVVAGLVFAVGAVKGDRSGTPEDHVSEP